MKTIVFASGNKHKIEEVKSILKDYDIIAMSEVGFDEEIDENGKDFFENSFIKAKAISDYLKKKNLDYMVLADDSGLCVDELNGDPGIHTARYAGDHDKEANRQKLLKVMKDITNRSANYTCHMILLRPDGKYISAVGKSYGKITHEYRGDTSFTFDCLFFSNDLNKTFGEATAEEKNRVSHRFRAIEDLLDKINSDAWEE